MKFSFGFGAAMIISPTGHRLAKCDPGVVDFCYGDLGARSNFSIAQVLAWRHLKHSNDSGDDAAGLFGELQASELPNP